MKAALLAHRLAWSAAILTLAGCESPSARIQENPAAFAALRPVEQETIKRGQVGLGFSAEMTYLAMGKPNLIEASADGRETTWYYMNYNTPDGAFVEANKTAISFDPLGSKSLAMNSGSPVAGKNDVGSRTRVASLAAEGQADNTDGGLGWRQVTGKADLDRGQIGLPDGMTRQKSAAEMIVSNERQDLLIKFYDGKIVDFRIERM
jgi:hypothetical protein